MNSRIAVPHLLRTLLTLLLRRLFVLLQLQLLVKSLCFLLSRLYPLCLYASLLSSHLVFSVSRCLCLYVSLLYIHTPPSSVSTTTYVQSHVARYASIAHAINYVVARSRFPSRMLRVPPPLHRYRLHLRRYCCASALTVTTMSIVLTLSTRIASLPAANA